MRGLLTLTVLVILVGCVQRTSSPFQSMRQRFAAVIRSGAVKVDVNAAVTAANQAPPTPPPAELARDRTKPRPTQPPLPVHRTNAARPTVFVLRGQTQAGAGICEPFSTSEACTSACTAKLRPNMYAAPGPSSLTSCACLEQDSDC